MNPMATSKADILKTSRELIQQNGWAAVNIRAVAAACGVSVGCIYNYFGSKTELVSATVESIWNVYGQTEPNVYELTLEYEYHPADALSGDVWLELDFGGDCARLYQDGKLLDDWFSNGELWRVALKRYGYPTKLTLELDPFKPDVYYDLPPKRENRLAGARLLRLS